KKLAALELNAPDDNPAGLVPVADAWYDAQNLVTDYPKRQLQLHIRDLYKKALSTASGFTKARIEKRIAEFEATMTDAAIASGSYPKLWPVLRAAVKDKSYEKIPIQGGAFGDKDYEALSADGGVLIGFHYTLKQVFGHDVLDCFQPI